MQLHVGDKLSDNSVVIRDEDRLCYQVLSCSKGVTGLRTISKALLQEWVVELQAHPDFSSDQMRKALSGKTEIDKFEYGYASTLRKMAEMVLGRVPVVHTVSDYSDAFRKWFAENRGNGTDTTAKKYLAYFKTLTDAYQEPTHSYWHGLYQLMYGHEAELEVSAIGELGTFDRVYGGILSALEEKKISGDMDEDGCRKAIDWFWQPAVKPHTCVTSALKAYRDFLDWREKHNPPHPDAMPAKASRRYWLIAPGEDAKFWGDWTENGIATIGWDFLGDLTKIDREEILAKINEEAADGKNHVHNALCCWQFCKEVRIGDVVIVKKGVHGLLGVGTIAGEYVYDEARDEHRHAHDVKWIATGDFTTSENLGKKTLTDLTPYPDFVYRLLTVMGVDPKQFEIAKPRENDDLTIALELFKARRDLFVEGEKVNDGIRAYFDPLTPEKLRAFTQAQFEDLFLGKGQYEHMWAGTNGMGWGHIKEAGCKASMEFIAKIRESPIPIDTFCDKKFDAPGGFGQVVIAELHLKFYPKDYCAYSKRTGIALEALKLKTNTYSGSFTAEDYLEVKEATEKIRKRMVDLGITRTRNDVEEADYLTANEFIDWVCNNKDLVKEKIMSSKMKKDKPTKLEDEKRVELKFDPNKKDDELLLRLLASLRAKPFAILAGHSGTGKSRYVKKLAYMTCNANELRVDGALPGNYLLLQVKPNWHDSTELLGFRNAMVHGQYQKTALIEFLFRAYHFKDTPFFLCLDEMNLAPVEQYFAEFLSAMESREPVPLNDITEKDENLFDLGCEWEDALDALKEHKFSIPKNLFIVGTVNMDETTNQFSRKVLDRAFTIEMTDVDFTKFDGKNGLEPSYGDTLKDDVIKELLAGEFNVKELDEEDREPKSPLIAVQQKLEQTPFAIAYRFASEYTLLKRALEVFDPGKTMKLDALDQAVLMKVLPRVAGEAEYIAKVYGKDESEGLRHALEGKTVSLKKIKEILDRAELTGAQYITFWP